MKRRSKLIIRWANGMEDLSMDRREKRVSLQETLIGALHAASESAGQTVCQSEPISTQ